MLLLIKFCFSSKLYKIVIIWNLRPRLKEKKKLVRRRLNLPERGNHNFLLRMSKVLM